jgi:hypothetical protein
LWIFADVMAGPAGHGTAYSFSGKSDVDVPYSPTLVAGSANIDISFWLSTTNLPVNGDYDLVRMGTTQPRSTRSNC